MRRSGKKWTGHLGHKSWCLDWFHNFERTPMDDRKSYVSLEKSIDTSEWRETSNGV